MSRIWGRSPIVTRRDVLAGIAAVGGTAALGRAGIAFAQDAKPLTWGSSSLGSTGYVILTTLASFVNKSTDLRNSAISTQGGTENIVLMGKGELDLGQTTSSGWSLATAGEKPFVEKVPLVQMFSYTIFQTSPMVRADSPINTVADLAGRRVMPAGAGGATALMFRILMEAGGVGGKINWTFGSWRETYDAMKAGAVDCIPTLMTNGRMSPVMTELTAGMAMRPVQITDDLVAAAQQQNPGILVSTVEPAQWDTLTEPAQLITESGILATTPRLGDDAGYAITKAVFDNAEEIRASGAQLRDVAPDFATRFLLPGFPVNAGAARYFKEKGVWRDDLTIAS
ncbi:MAG: TAXI family TRAP transporter solute-binding subunit [Alphaproteobacteria bacterium]